jgi:starch synthase/alpha-amylase
MIAPIYGTLPVAHDTGGIHDTVTHLDVTQDTGNGFLFKHHDSQGLFWAIEQAMDFYCLPPDVREVQLKRVMKEGKSQFNHRVTAQQYIGLYETMLQRPLVNKF